MVANLNYSMQFLRGLPNIGDNYHIVMPQKNNTTRSTHNRLFHHTSKFESISEPRVILLPGFQKSKNDRVVVIDYISEIPNCSFIRGSSNVPDNNIDRSIHDGRRWGKIVQILLSGGSFRVGLITTVNFITARLIGGRMSMKNFFSGV